MSLTEIFDNYALWWIALAAVLGVLGVAGLIYWQVQEDRRRGGWRTIDPSKKNPKKKPRK